MKKIKKVLAALTTAAISAVSFSSLFTVNAVADYDTYRFYFDVASNSGLNDLYVSMSYKKTMFFDEKLLGNCGGSLYGGGSAGTTYYNCGMGFTASNGSNLTNAGTMFTAEFYTLRTSSDWENNLWDNLINNFVISATKSNGNTVSNNKYSYSVVLVGDATQDGEVDVRDIMALNQFINGTANLTGDAYRAADVNGDGLINADDTDIIRQYTIGDILHF